MDPIENRLRDLSSEPLEARQYKTTSEKKALIMKVGPRTCRSIINAKKDYSISRIPFLFSSIHPQLVVDVLANDLMGLVESMIKEKK